MGDGLFISCNECRKRFIIYKLIKCKCKLMLCKKCKRYENHKCSFNYLKENQKVLKEKNLKLCPKQDSMII